MSETNITTFPASEDEEAEVATTSAAPAPKEGETREVGGITGDRLRAFVERVERLEEEKTALMEDIKEIYGEAKAVGFDVKTLRTLVKLRKMDTEKRREEDELLELYKSAIGLL